MAVLGAVIPILFFANFSAEAGIDLVAFVQALFVNGAAGGFTADLLISSFVFWVYMFSRQDRGAKPWLFIVLNLFIGLSCALPAYLWASAKSET
jgi:fluoride ion exporter CrcB/FEX